MKCSNKYHLIVPTIFTLFLMACSRQPYVDNSPLLAKVGDLSITEKSFIESYGFGPSALKSINGAKESYLRAMINEAVLAQLPEVQQKVTDKRIQQSMRLLRQELLVEKMFNVEVGDKITVSEDEIKDEAIKSSIESKVKYIYTEDKEEAERFEEELNNGADFDSLLSKKLERLGLVFENGETDFIKYGELDEPFNEIVFNLKPYEVSPIISSGKGYFIIKKTDSRKSIISDMDIVQYHHRYEQIVRYKKDRIRTGKFLKEFMDPKKVVVDGKIFRILADAIYSLEKNNGDLTLKQTQQQIDTVPFTEIADKLSDYYNEPVVRFHDGFWTVKELLYHLSYRPLDFRASDINELAGKLRDIIGRTIRDVCMEEEALDRKYDRDPEIRYELDRWQRKYTTQLFMDSIKSECYPDTSEVRSFFHNLHYGQNVTFDNVKTYLMNLMMMKNVRDTLLAMTRRSGIKVTTYPENLEKVAVDEPRAGRLPDVKLYKLGLPYWREAFPTPDVLWGAEEIIDKLKK